MKIIVEHDGVKREIAGSFNVCGSASDLRSMARQILGGLEAWKEVHGHDGTFGWVPVLDNRPVVSVANQKPLPWK